MATCKLGLLVGGSFLERGEVAASFGGATANQLRWCYTGITPPRIVRRRRNIPDSLWLTPQIDFSASLPSAGLVIHYCSALLKIHGSSRRENSSYFACSPVSESACCLPGQGSKCVFIFSVGIYLIADLTRGRCRGTPLGKEQRRMKLTGVQHSLRRNKDLMNLLPSSFFHLISIYFLLAFQSLLKLIDNSFCYFWHAQLAALSNSEIYVEINLIFEKPLHREQQTNPMAFV